MGCSGCTSLLPEGSAAQRRYCDACRLARKRSSHAEAKSRWLEKHPGRKEEYRRRAILKHRYGITPEQREEMLQSQGGMCAIEGCTSEASRIDHCHQTGKVRGMLCHSCNLRLSGLEDLEWRERALRYLAAAEEVITR